MDLLAISKDSITSTRNNILPMKWGTTKDSQVLIGLPSNQWVHQVQGLLNIFVDKFCEIIRCMKPCLTTSCLDNVLCLSIITNPTLFLTGIINTDKLPCVNWATSPQLLLNIVSSHIWCFTLIRVKFWSCPLGYYIKLL